MVWANSSRWSCFTDLYSLLFTIMMIIEVISDSSYSYHKLSGTTTEFSQKVLYLQICWVLSILHRRIYGWLSYAIYEATMDANKWLLLFLMPIS